ncbi:hypothetical protein [Halobaculum litoreum]|uniref:Uncharacterized protein n=1 Tax=Halobaculum litoreum TaxID=3031998 RepID=A0ABD5XQG7_9EURY|nr:hypothetical protein [Halobaculum sp. DT92]
MSEDLLADRRVDAAVRAATPPVNVTALRTRPDRTVFTEDDNADGWIATDLTVAVEQ